MVGNRISLHLVNEIEKKIEILAEHHCYLMVNSDN